MSAGTALATCKIGPVERFLADGFSTSIREISSEPSDSIAPSTFTNIPGTRTDKLLIPRNTVEALDFAISVLVPNGPAATERVRLPAVVCNAATIASSPVTLPFSELVGDADKEIGVNWKVGVSVKPWNGGLL